MKHKPIYKLFIITVLMLALAGILWATALADTPQPLMQLSPQADVGTSFTYQGRLLNSSMPVNGACDFQFSLWDASGGGNQVGSTQTKSAVSLSNGYFNTALDFGVTAFEGAARYLQISLRCPAGGGAYTPLTGRVELAAAPYALSLRPGATVSGDTSSNILTLENSSATGAGVRGVTTSSGNGVEGVVDWTAGADGAGFYGQGGFYGYAAIFNNITSNIATVVITNSNYAAGGPALAVWGNTTVIASTDSTSSGALTVNNTRSYGTAIWGEAEGTTAGSRGVFGYAEGSSGQTYGVLGTTNSATSNASGVRGYSWQGSTNGVWGETNSDNGGSAAVFAYASNASGSAIPLWVRSDGLGDLIRAYKSTGGSGDLKFQVTNGGEVYADGSFHGGGADYAEMLPGAEGLEAGDVLAIGPKGQLVRSSQPYQLTVAGVYSTQPGFVSGDASDAERVPLAVVGVAPVKVTAENGAIQPGDMLVASSLPGYAMRAGANPPNGSVIGKALGALSEDSGVIQMLVILQ